MANMTRFIVYSQFPGEVVTRTPSTASLIDADQSNATVLRYSLPNPRNRPKTMPQAQYQIARQVADRMKISNATVRHRIRTGQPRAIGIGKGWRIAATDPREFLSTHQTPPRTQVVCPNVHASQGETPCHS